MTEKAASAQIEPWLREILQPRVPRRAGRRRGSVRAGAAPTPSAARVPHRRRRPCPPRRRGAQAGLTGIPHGTLPRREADRQRGVHRGARLARRPAAAGHGRRAGPPGADPRGGRHPAGGRESGRGRSSSRRSAGRPWCATSSSCSRSRLAGAGEHAAQPALPGWWAARPRHRGVAVRSAPPAARARGRGGRRGASLLTVGAAESPWRTSARGPAGCTSTGNDRDGPAPTCGRCSPRSCWRRYTGTGRREREVLEAVADRLDERAEACRPSSSRSSTRPRCWPPTSPRACR